MAAAALVILVVQRSLSEEAKGALISSFPHLRKGLCGVWQRLLADHQNHTLYSFLALN